MPASLVLTNANLIDCVNPGVAGDATVVIEDGRIVEVGAGRVGSTGGLEAIDLAGAFLLPGLWDVHIHPEYPVPPGMTVAQETANFGRMLSMALTEAGVTGVRCAGAAHFMDVAWKRVFDAGDVVGPRVFASGLFSDHHGRTLFDLGPSAGVRRALRVCAGHPGADEGRS